MQFDSACGSGIAFRGSRDGRTTFSIIKEMYANAGYTAPRIVFWNLNSKDVNVSAQAHDSDVALVSGFSPSLFKVILDGDMTEFTPVNVMLKTLSKYSVSAVKLV